MSDSVNIHVPKLYRLLRPVVVWPEFGGPRTLEAGTVVWLHGNRRSSLDGYIGTFSETYRHPGQTGPSDVYSPKDGRFHFHMENVEAVVPQNPFDWSNARKPKQETS